MSDIFQTEINSTEPVSKYAIGIRYGLILGFLSMFVTTISFLYLLKISIFAFYAAMLAMLVVSIILYSVAAKRQRALMGGFISLKDAFQVIFIIILISSIISTVYGLIYNKIIDPEAGIRMKEAMMEMFEGFKMPQDQIDQQMVQVDARLDESTNFSSLMLSFALSIVGSSIIGFIVALVVKKERVYTAQ